MERSVVEVAGAAARADADRLGGQLGVGRGGVAPAEREQRPDDAVGATLVVDEAARAELREREEARALQVGLPPAPVRSWPGRRP